MYKKTSPVVSSPYLAPLVACIMTVIVFCLAEYFFLFPSSFLHSGKILDMIPPATLGKVCTQEYAPICGKDGITYDNSCYAKSAGVTIARAGKCDASVSNSGGVASVISTSLVSGESVSSVLISTASGSISVPIEVNLDITKYQLYTNTVFKYAVALPKYAYYQGQVSTDKRSHILTVGLDSPSVSTPTTALVTATYYRAGLTAPTSKRNITLESGTLMLDYTEPLSLKGQAIVDAIVASAKSY